MRKIFSISILLLSTSALAFGGGGSNRTEKAFDRGLNAIGIHYGGNGRPTIIDLSDDPNAHEVTPGVWQCNDGYIINYKQAKCVACPAGTYAVSGDVSCTTTPAGYYSPEAAGEPTICPDNTYQPQAGQSQCLPVDEGYEPAKPIPDAEVPCSDTTTPGACNCEETHVADGEGSCVCPPDTEEVGGVCVAKVPCTSNTDCAQGQYCRRTGEGSTATGGTCQNLGSFADATIAGLGTVRKSDDMMSQWAADNWCKAQGKSLLEAKDIKCYNGDTLLPSGSYGYCCAKGKTCGSWTNYWSDLTTINPADEATVTENYSPILIALRKMLGTGDGTTNCSGKPCDWSWTGTAYGSDKKHYIYFTMGMLNTWLSPYNEGGHAICMLEKDQTDCTGKTDGTSCSTADVNAVCINESCDCQYTDQVIDATTYTCATLPDKPHCNKLTEKAAVCTVDTTTKDENYICVDKNSTFNGSTGYSPCDGKLKCTETITVNGHECCATYECGLGCESNADCADGEFCKPTGEGSTITGASCQPLGTYADASVGTMSVRKSDDMMSQWAADNWCKAQGANLVQVSDIKCYNGNTLITNQSSYAYCCAQGKTCSSWTNYWSDATTIKPESEETVNATYSPTLIALRKALGKNDAAGYDWSWTGTPYSATKTLYVYFTSGMVNTHFNPYNEGGHALCKLPLQCPEHEVEQDDACVCDNANGWYGTPGACIECRASDNKTWDGTACVCAEGYIDDGQGGCAVKPASCSSNADCAEGQFCKQVGEKQNNCAVITGGTCQPIGDYTDATVAGVGTIRRSDSPMSWWAATNWCAAQGTSLIEISDLECYKSGTETAAPGPADYCCAKGKTCSSWTNYWNDDATMKNEYIETVTTNYSPKMISLRQTLGGNGHDWGWTSTTWDNCTTLYAHMKFGMMNKFLARYNEGGYALCKVSGATDLCADYQPTACMPTCDPTTGEGIPLGEGTTCATNKVCTAASDCVCAEGYIDDGQGGCVEDIPTCSTNADCANGEYCKLTGTSSTVGTGTCESLGTYVDASITGLGTLRKSDDMMSYWAADNWCKAQGKVLIETKDVGCYSGTTLQTNPTYAYCCASGKSCPQSTWNGNWSDATTIKPESEATVYDLYSPTLIEMRQKLGKNDAAGYDWSWTSTVHSASKMMYVYFTFGNINRNFPPSNEGGHALCK